MLIRSISSTSACPTAQQIASDLICRASAGRGLSWPVLLPPRANRLPALPASLPVRTDLAPENESAARQPTPGEASRERASQRFPTLGRGACHDRIHPAELAAT